MSKDDWEFAFLVLVGPFTLAVAIVVLSILEQR